MSLPRRLRPFTDAAARSWAERAVGLKALTFAAVGLVNTLVDFAVFALCYFTLGLPIVGANVLSWLVAVSGSYVLNSQITFAPESGGRLRPGDYLTFALSQTAGLVANTATVLLASYFMPVLAGKALAVAVSFLVNFSLSNFVVFRRRP